jgi:hypothetical protein
MQEGEIYQVYIPRTKEVRVYMIEEVEFDENGIFDGHGEEVLYSYKVGENDENETR